MVYSSSMKATTIKLDGVILEELKAFKRPDQNLTTLVRELLKAQIEANKVQASSTNIFVAGARPAAMWVCVLGLIYNFLGYPFVRWGNAVFSWTNTPPELDNTTLTWLVAGLFGLTAARSYEKRKRVATSDFRSHPDEPRTPSVNTPPK